MARGQASLFDGITFLTLSMFSIAFIFMALGNYGSLQQSVINKAHLTAYLMDSFKTIYYVDASTLSAVNCADDAGYCKTGSAVDMGCGTLSNWRGVTVAELLKRDLRDFDGASVGGVYENGLDDRYGMAPAPGKQAARCAFKEIFKPFTTAGYSYFVEFRRVVGSSLAFVPEPDMAITNVQALNSGTWKNAFKCDGSSQVYSEMVVVTAPFQVFQCDADNICQSENYKLYACIWPTQKIS